MATKIAAKRPAKKAATSKKAGTKKSAPSKAAKATATKVTVVGILTAEGVECQALRADRTRKLYTLVPRSKLRSFKNGDHVRVIGSVVEISFCQQGTTVSIQTITRVR